MTKAQKNAATGRKPKSPRLPGNLERTLDTVQKLENYFRKTKEQTVVLFADLANSTEYKQKRSFVMGLHRTRVHNDIITGIIEKAKGQVVKYIGDAVMARFDLGKRIDLAARAVNAAIQIQEALSDYNKDIKDQFERVESKIGIACGVVADFYSNDPQGAVVDLAARVQSTAKARQILVEKTMLDSCNLNLITSCYGEANGWRGANHLDDVTRLALKGIPEPVELVEVVWDGTPKGIKAEFRYDEYWEQYRYDATIYPLDESYPEELRLRYFGIMFDLRYRTTLTKKSFRFVCVNNIDRLSKAMKDRSLFSRYMLPNSKWVSDNIERVFNVDFFNINRLDLQQVGPADSQVNDDLYYFSRDYTHPEISSLLGRDVLVHYRVSSIIAKRGHFFAMLTEYPVKDLSMKLLMDSVPIRSVRPIDYFAAKQEPRFIYTPSHKSANQIEVFFDGWIYPRGGVVFVWDLKDYSEALPPL